MARCEVGCTCGRHYVKPGTRGGYRWSTADPSRPAMHKRIVTRRGRAAEYDCIDCGVEAKDWSHTHGTSRQNANNYEPRCRLCHRRYDWPEFWGKPGYREVQLSLMVGRKHSAETRAKMSESAKRRWDRDKAKN